MKKEDRLKLFDVNEEEYEKSKDILPTFDMGKLGIGCKAQVQILAEEPKKIMTRDINSKDKNAKVETLVIPVLIEKTIEKNATGEMIDIPYGEKMSLFLSSKTLRMGIMKAVEEKESIMGSKLMITVSEANYQQGTNRCYNVTLLN